MTEGLGTRRRFSSPEAPFQLGGAFQAGNAVGEVQNEEHESRDEADLKKLSYFGSEMVSIQLRSTQELHWGGEVKTVTPIIQVHARLLHESSNFFRVRAKPEWADKTDHVVDLSDEDPSIFKIFAHFVYTKKVEFNKGGNPSQPFRNLVKSYILGEKLMAAGFQNAVIKAIVKYQAENDKFPGNDAIRIAYEGTLPNAPLRKLLVDFWARAAYSGWEHRDLINVTSPEFVQDLIEAILKRRSRLPKDKRDHWSKHASMFYVDEELMPEI